MSEQKPVVREGDRIAELTAERDAYAAALHEFNCFDLDEGDLRILMISLKSSGLTEVDDAYATRYGNIRRKVRQLDPTAILEARDKRVRRAAAKRCAEIASSYIDWEKVKHCALVSTIPSAAFISGEICREFGLKAEASA